MERDKIDGEMTTHCLPPISYVLPQMEGSAVLTLLRSRSQINNYSQAVHGTYLLATGAQRQHISVLSTLGSSVGYSGIIDQRKPISLLQTTVASKSVCSICLMA